MDYHARHLSQDTEIRVLWDDGHY